MGYARDWGHGGLIMLNLFAFRATDPLNMKKASSPVGDGNDATLLKLTDGSTVLAAWGTHGRWQNRDLEVCRLLLNAEHPRNLVGLGTTNDGGPRHPLYMKKDVKPSPYGGPPGFTAMKRTL
jgi:hypothetical protein